MIKIPNDTWSVVNNSDIYGDIVRTRNMDFNESGYATLARKAIALFTEHTGVSTTGDANFTDCIAIASDDTFYFLITTDHCFSITASETALTVAEISTGSAPSVVGTSDCVYYNGAFAVTGSTTLHSYTPSSWTDRSLSLSASYPHPMAVFENRRSLCIGNGNVVHQLNAEAWTENTTDKLTLPANHIVTTMRWRGNNLYIGTRTLTGQEGKVFVWSGSGTSASAGYEVGSDWVYSMTNYGSSVAILTSAGQIRRFNGGGFDDLVNLPVYYTPHSWTENAGAATVGKAINRSMWTIGDTIYFTIQGEPRGLFAPGSYKQPGGLWVYDPEVGLYHKSGFVTEPYRRLAISSLNSSIFSFASAHGLSTGDAVWASSVSNIAALTAGWVYYAIVESTTSFKLARSKADADAGEFIICTGTISGDTLSVDTLDTVGNINSCVPGAVHGFTRNQLSPFFGSEVLFAGSAQDPTNNTISSIMSLGMGRNVGSFVTPKIFSSNVRDIYQKIVQNIRGINLDTDKVVIKYRVFERFGLPTPVVVSSAGLATWVDTTSFTVDTTGKDVKSAAIGDEVEISLGAGAGYSAHITAINDNTSTYTFTIDEAIPEISASDKSDIIVNNWVKLATITNEYENLEKGFIEKNIGEEAKGAWIQFKVELRGTEISVNMMKIINELYKPAN